MYLIYPESLSYSNRVFCALCDYITRRSTFGCLWFPFYFILARPLFVQALVLDLLCAKCPRLRRDWSGAGGLLGAGAWHVVGHSNEAALHMQHVYIDALYVYIQAGDCWPEIWETVWASIIVIIIILVATSSCHPVIVVVHLLILLQCFCFIHQALQSPSLVVSCLSRNFSGFLSPSP